jgi:hypothetical protein
MKPLTTAVERRFHTRQFLKRFDLCCLRHIYFVTSFLPIALTLSLESCNLTGVPDVPGSDGMEENRAYFWL